jgi:hypothetical protein
MPKQGGHAPWRLHQNYPRDVRMFRLSRLLGNGLRFSGRSTVSRSNKRERLAAP